MARRAKPSDAETITATPRSARELFDEHYPFILDAKASLDKAAEAQRKANSAYRSKLKNFKTAGGDIDAMVQALALAKRDPDEVTREFRNVNNYLRYMGVPIGTQLGLFDDGQTVATKAENDKLGLGAKDDEFEEGRSISTAKAIAEAKTKGFDAGSGNIPFIKNPYEEGSPEFLAWSGAWQDAQAKIAHSLGGKSKSKSKNGNGAHASA